MCTAIKTGADLYPALMRQFADDLAGCLVGTARSAGGRRPMGSRDCLLRRGGKATTSAVMTRLAFALALLAAPLPAAAHPHVFIDAGVDFLFDVSGRLSHLRVTWIYDPLSSLFMLEDLGITEGPDGTIDATAKAKLAHDQSQWVEGFQGDSYLHAGDQRVALSGPTELQADYQEGAVEIRFLRAVADPFHPEGEIRAALYDPTYYSAYFVTLEPKLEQAPDGCRAEVVPFEPTGGLAALQESLFALPADADPEEDVGHLFADRVFLRCG